MSKRIFLSCDPGIDDMAAILFALADRDVELLGVGAVAGNVSVETAWTNARFACDLAGAAATPCYAGSSGPLLRDQIFGAHKALGVFRDHLSDLEDSLPEARLIAIAPAQTAAVAMAHAITDAAVTKRPLTLVATGPLTDVALAIRLAGSEACADGIATIVAMGGAFRALGNRAPYAEMNMLSDPHAARMVAESGLPLVLFPLDVTWQCRLTGQDLDRIECEAGLIGQIFARLFRASDRENPVLYGGPGGPVHDLLTVIWLVAPELFILRRARISVSTGHELAGHTSRQLPKAKERDNAGCKLPHCIADGVESDAVRALFLDRLKTFSRASDSNNSDQTRITTNREEDPQ
nr:nucleoside hydrolase [uncultured Cohaesibacter sp.]